VTKQPDQPRRLVLSTANLAIECGPSVAKHTKDANVRTAHLGGRLQCMLLTLEARIARVHLASGELMVLDRTPVDFNPANHTRSYTDRTARMTIAPNALERLPHEDFLDWGRRWSSVARRALVRDRYHSPIAWLFGEAGELLTTIQLNVADQAAKYVSIRRLADEVEGLGAHGLIFVNEVWQAMIAKEELGPTMRRASERPDRTETLVVTLATSDGRVRTYLSPFSRDSRNRPVFAEEQVSDERTHWLPYPASIQVVWRRWAERTTDRDPRP
jgi:hypothetical protein